MPLRKSCWWLDERIVCKIESVLKGIELRKSFLVQGEVDEAIIRGILKSIVRGIEYATHKVKYRTSRGIVEYVSLPLGSGLDRYSDVGVSNTLRKVVLWSHESVEVLEEMLRSSGIEMVEIIKDGPKTVELKL